MKKTFVKDLKKDEEVEDIFFILSRRERKTKEDKPFLYLQLLDKTGVIEGRVFEGVEKYAEIGERKFARVKGRVSEYQNRLGIVISELKPVAEEEVNREDFLIRKSEKEIAEMLKEIKGYISEIEDPFLRPLLDSFFTDKEFVEAFKLTPAALKAHQAYPGGLLEHTLYLARLSRAGKEIYPSDFNFPLLLTGAILHDIGKIREYEFDITVDISTEGRLIGHIVLGYEMVKERIEKIKNFPQNLKNKLLHLILSSHGEIDYGSPVGPKIPEAFFLYHIDNLDAKMAMVREWKEKTKDQDWSEYHRLLETYIYFG